MSRPGGAVIGGEVIAAGKPSRVAGVADDGPGDDRADAEDPRQVREALTVAARVSSGNRKVHRLSLRGNRREGN
jgi:hypothetical protein